MSTSAPVRDSAGRRLLAVATVGALTAGYLWFHRRTHDAGDLRSAAEHLLQGRTHWVTFQNRLLAPALIDAVRGATGWEWLRAFYAVLAASLAGGGGVLLWRSWRDTGKSARGLAQTAGWFLLAVALNHRWSYPWDFTGALLFLLLAVWARDCFGSLASLKSWRLAILLAALALNRESSLFVFAALGATVLVAGLQAGRPARAFVPAVFIALAGGANLVGVLLVRQALFVAPTRPAGAVGPEMASGNFNQVRHNWHVLTHPGEGWPAMIVVAGLLLLTGLIGREIYRALRAAQPLAPGRLFLQLGGVAGTGAILLFADVSELRVYFEFVPVWLLLATEAGPGRAELRGG
ncbi:MAG: hypothetical protein HY302_02085 [Opitutae bacterium]|nr:hypothetical protein [Opitutae bacterium]